MQNVSSSNSQAVNVPKLRFPGFTDEWIESSLGEIIKENLHPIPMPTEDYVRLGIFCHAKGTFHEFVPIEKALAVDKMFVVEKDNLIVNITFAWEHAVAITTQDDEGKLVSHRFPTYSFNDGEFSKFYKYSILRPEFKYQLGAASPGGAGRNRVLNRTAFLEIPMIKPQKQEQEKIAMFLELISKRIEAQKNMIETLKLYKRGVLNKVFRDNSDWKVSTIRDCLKYEQPQKYIVQSEKYQDTFTTPVLTANKAFILGYTNETTGIYNKGEVIIYDDFTMETKYVDFDFKVKSSTIKMLTPRQGIDLYFMFSYFQFLSLKPEGHQRSYISLVEPMEISIPDYEVQLHVSESIKKIDRKIRCAEETLDKCVSLKVGLLQQMFI